MLAGCTDYRQIKVGGIGLAGFDFTGTSSAVLKVKAEVDNPTGKPLMLESVDAVLVKDGRDFAMFTLSEPVTSESYSDSVIVVPVKVSVVDPIAIIASGLDFSSWDLDELTVNGKMVFRYGKSVKKTLSLHKKPVRDLIEIIAK